ncbi:hypothetical protein GCM10009639_33240 [Kitasatospora putterlickiae]|uniref:Uncharacterized protein n=1 Tax=Kitasatospora putterlickiae TaxID=221725 RepID=A0ABN1Y376_9ACTN
MTVGWAEAAFALLMGGCLAGALLFGLGGGPRARPRTPARSAVRADEGGGAVVVVAGDRVRPAAGGGRRRSDVSGVGGVGGDGEGGGGHGG